MRKVTGYAILVLLGVMVFGGLEYLCWRNGVWWLLPAALLGIIIFIGLMIAAFELIGIDK